MYFEETENEFRDYFVRIDITKKVEIPSGDIVEAMLNMRIRILKIKIKSYWRIKEKIISAFTLLYFSPFHLIVMEKIFVDLKPGDKLTI